MLASLRDGDRQEKTGHSALHRARPSNLETALGLGDAALSRGADLYLYLIDDGVRALGDARLRALPGRGAKLFVCAYGCQKRRIPLEDDPAISYCGLVVLTDVINGTDRFVALN